MLTLVVLGAAVGLVASLLLPMLLKPTRFAGSVGQSYFEFTMKALKRPGIGVGKHGDLSLRQLSFDDVYDQEVITVGDVEKKITRSSKNVHRVGATPFAFFDEVFGVTFDLRDVLIGQLERRHREDGEMVFRYEEFDDTGQPTRLERYVRAFFEVEERPALEMDLDESIRPIVDGSEQAHWWEYMWEAVRRMYIHRQEEMSILKMLIPFGVLGGALFLGYYLFGPGNMPGGGSGAADPVSVGALLLLGMPDWSREQAAKRVGGAVAVLGVLAAVLVTVPMGTLVILTVSVLAGAAILPVLTLIAGGVGHGVGLADLFLWAALQAFDEPVVDLTEDDRYRLVEAEELGLENVPKVKLSKTLVGFSCDVSPDAFGRAGYTSADLQDYLPTDVMLSDGGNSALPRGYVTAEGLENAGHRGFVPQDPDENTTYVRSDNWLARFKDIATGDSLDVAESEATKEFADGSPEWTDGQLMKYSGISAAVGLGFWVVVALAF